MKNRKTEEKPLSHVDEIFLNKNLTKMNSRFDRSKKNLLRYGILIAIVVILGVYFNLPHSYVHSVSIDGNYNLNDDYIQTAAEIDQESRYYLTVPFVERIKLKKHPLIKDASVKWIKGNEININVNEKKAIGYCYDNEEPIVLLSDGTSCALESEFLDIIANVPLIIGFSEPEQTRKLCNAFDKVNTEVISQIAEVSQYSLAYDSETIKILMRTGSYFITNYHDLYLINSFNYIYNRLNDKNMCIYTYASDTGSNVYTRECPWNEKEENIEYWTDENGEVITNEFGDKVAKHYYQNDKGKYVKDNEGKKIVVPLNAKGHEVYDEDFMEHYNAGYYADGVLKLPEAE